MGKVLKVCIGRSVVNGLKVGNDVGPAMLKGVGRGGCALCGVTTFGTGNPGGGHSGAGGRGREGAGGWGV